jgi:hypothetical protein
MHFTLNSLMMVLHHNLRNKHLFTHITAIWTIIAVKALKVLLQTALINEGLTEQTARERTLSSMQALIFLQITLTIQ